MREAFRIIARWLQDSGIKPRDVEVIIRFKDKRDREKASFAAGKEFESVKRLPGIPELIYAGDFYGVTFELRSHVDGVFKPKKPLRRDATGNFIPWDEEHDYFMAFDPENPDLPTD